MDQDQLHEQMASAVDLSQPETHRSKPVAVSSAWVVPSALVAASALLAACTSSGGASAAGAGAGDFAKTPGFKFTFVNHVTTNPFFQATQYGLQDAAALLGIPTPAWTGSETSDVSQMVNAMNTAITSKVDGIAIALVDQRRSTTPPRRPCRGHPGRVVQRRRRDERTPDLHRPGPLRERPGDGREDRSCVPVRRQHRDLHRHAGLAEHPAPRRRCLPRSRRRRIHGQADRDRGGHQAEQTAIDAFYTGNKDFKGLYAVDAGSTQGIANVIKKYGLASKGYHGGGFDLLTPTRTRSRRDLRLHHRPVGLPAGLPADAVPVPLQAVGHAGRPAVHEHRLKFVARPTSAPTRSTNRFEGRQAAVHQVLTHGARSAAPPVPAGGGHETAPGSGPLRRCRGLCLPGAQAAVVCQHRADRVLRDRHPASSPPNISNIADFFSAAAIIAAGEVFLLICGDIDLSAGMTFALVRSSW